jgi:translation initiation factor 5B
MIRQPIIVVMGHVDHGKTSLLDRIRSTTITNREAGGITQHIGASEVPIDVVERICGPLLKRFNASITIPGLLFIDTPGHEAFTNLRRRGGSVADLAILVVDVSKNFEPQTYEAIEILKEYKTPFIVAANKIDLITGWRASATSCFSETIPKQQRNVSEELESRIYSLIGKLSELGFNSERFDRIKDFKSEIVIVPISAKTGEGVAELLMYAAGLAQRFLEMRLNIEVSGPGVGSIIERKEEKGLGSTIDVILYNGTLKVNDTIAFATSSGTGTAKIKALLKPKPLQELRESSSKFYYIDSVSAAAGIKISGSGMDDAIPGSLVISTEQKDYEKEIASELQEVFATEKNGVVLKADTIGSIEAISKLLNSAGVPISKKAIGTVTKRDVLDAFSMRAVDPDSAAVLAFNMPVEEEAAAEAYATGIEVIRGEIIYKLIDDYREWAEKERKKGKEIIERSLTFPGKMKVLPNTCFRVSHPAIFGIEVISGRVKPSVQLMNAYGEIVGKVREIQDNGVSMQEARIGVSAAISVEDATFGRQIRENEQLYVFMNDENERLLRYKFNELMNEEERSLLDETSSVKSAGKKGPIR